MNKSLFFAVILAGCCTGSWGQQYPGHTVRIVVPFPAGSATDQLARVVAQQLHESLGQPFIIDNKAGALATIGTAEVAHSTPDGYTLVFGTNTTHAANVGLFKNLPYDPVKDFAPIIRTTTVPMVLVVRSDFAAHTVREFIDIAKRRPGELAGGFYSAGSQVAVVKFKNSAKIAALDVPYKGSPATMTDLMGGHIAYSIVDLTVALPLINGGKLKGLGVTSLSRTPSLPAVPPIAAEFPGFEVMIWHGLAAPAGTPRDVINVLYTATLKAITRPDTRAQLAKMDLTVDPLTADQFGEFIKSEIARWSKEIKEAGIEAQ
jgi:tripartite-type tricarboxylate transporter receptor subunit TctC